jgi:hypothetical protein
VDVPDVVELARGIYPIQTEQQILKGFTGDWEDVLRQEPRGGAGD